MNILEKIYYNAIKYPKNIIIKNITNEQFWNNILKYSNYYCKKVDKKDIIIVENTQDEYFLYTLFSLNLLGAIVLPLDRNTSYNIMLDTLNKIGASKILKKDDIKNSKILNYTKINNYSFPNINDTSLILLSSGTTGIPKFIEIKYKTIYNIIKSNKESFKFLKNNKIVVTGDISHSYSIMKVLTSIYYNMYIILYNSKNIVDFMSIICSNLKNLVICTNPVFLHYLITIFNNDFKNNINNISSIITATSPLIEKDAKLLLKIIKGKNIKFYNHYGATEVDNLCYDDISKNGYKFNCVGKPMLGTSIEIVDTNDNIMSSTNKKYGRVRILSNGFSNYYNTLDDSKYFYTGDLGYIENNCLYIVDREKNFFNINGYKVSPNQIENVALKYSYVDECICLYDNILILKVVVSDGFNINKLKKILYENLLSYQLPKKIEVVSSIIKNNSGKVDRKAYK